MVITRIVRIEIIGDINLYLEGLIDVQRYLWAPDSTPILFVRTSDWTEVARRKLIAAKL